MGHWVFCLGHELIYTNIYNNLYIQYIIVYIIRLCLKFNNTKIKIVIGLWYIYKLKVLKKRVTMKKGREPLICWKGKEGWVLPPWGGCYLEREGITDEFVHPINGGQLSEVYDGEPS